MQRLTDEQRDKVASVYPLICQRVNAHAKRHAIKINSDLYFQLLHSIEMRVMVAALSHNSDVSKFSTYAVGAISFGIRDFIHEIRKPRISTMPLEDISDPPYTNHEPDTDPLDRFCTLMGDLTERDQAILDMLLLQELSQQEVATKVGLSANRIGQIYQRIKEQLRERIQSMETATCA